MTSSRSGRTGQPLWGLIVDELAQEIVEDQLPPGTKLPVEADLMERFGVSRFTLRRAMGVLEERGLIFVGIDVIGGFMTEINVTSPTGLQEIDRFDEVSLESDIWDAIERRFNERHQGRVPG